MGAVYTLADNIAGTIGPWWNNRFCMRAREYPNPSYPHTLFLPLYFSSRVNEFLIFYTPSYRVWPGRRARTVFRYIIFLFSLLHFPFLTFLAIFSLRVSSPLIISPSFLSFFASHSPYTTNYLPHCLFRT